MTLARARSRSRSRSLPAAGSVAAATALLLVLAGCGSSDASNSTASSTASSTRPTAKPPIETPAGTGLRAKRYCEVLLVSPSSSGGVSADVYNSFPMNACPQAQWVALDAKAIATSNQALIALLNGPRYWLMDRIKKTAGPELHQDFGGIDMIKRATVAITDIVAANKPYNVNHVNRKTEFTFNAGSEIYELTDPGGAKYVMQSWSQQIDPNLVESGLASLGARLALPPGWSFATRKLTAPLRVVTTTTDATVVQDDLKTSYSQETTT